MSFASNILKAKKQELLAQVADLRKSLRELDAALEVLEGRSKNDASPNAGGSPINAGIIEAIKHGNGTLGEIFNFVTHSLEIDTSKASVSTRLSKMKGEGLIDHDGDQWVLSKKDEGSDVGASEPSDLLGPVGRERGYPPSAPEGSIPSGSTESHDPREAYKRFIKDHDSEIPF